MNRIWKILLSVLVVVVVLILAFPTLLSSNWIRPHVVASLNKSIPGSLVIKNYQIGWFSGVQIEELELKDPNGKLVARFDHFSNNSSLFKLWLKGLVSGKWELHSFHANIHDKNLEETLGIPYHFLSNAPLTLSEVNGFVDANGPIHMNLTGNTQHGQVRGQFDIQANITEEDMKLNVNLSKFPVEIVGALVATYDPHLGKLIPLLVGESLDLKVKDLSDSKQTTFEVQATSRNLFADFEGMIVDNVLRLKREGKSTLKVMPDRLGGIIPFQLLAPLNITLTVNELNLPLKFITGEKGIDPKEIVLVGNVNIPQTEIEKDSQNISLSDFNVKIDTRQGSDSLGFFLNGYLNRISVGLNSSIKKPKHINGLTQKIFQTADFHLKLNEIPTTLLGEHSEKAFGKTVSLGVKGSSKNSQRVFLEIDSERIKAHKIEVAVNEKILSFDSLLKNPLSGHVSIDKLILAEATVSDLKMPWQVDVQEKKGKAEISAKLAQQASFSGKVEVDGLTSRLYTQLQGTQIPTALIQLATGQDFIEPLFGKTVDTDLLIDFDGKNGKGSIHVKGPQGLLRFKGNIHQGILTLTDPFYMETKPTRELGVNFLSQYVPTFKELVKGSHLLNIQIEKEGFSVPITSFDLSKIQIGQGTLNLSKLTFQNEGEIKNITRFLKSTNTNEVSIWFTPQYFNVVDGILNLARTDMLIMDHYPVAVWGVVDLPNQKLNAGLGLSGYAIAQAFSLEGMEHEKIVLKVPIKGKIDNAKVDTTSVSAQVGSLLAKQQGGPEGILLGAVLDIAHNSLTDGKIPSPTTNPLPWSELLAKTTEKPEQKAAKSSLNKEIEKGAKGLLKNLLK